MVIDFSECTRDRRTDYGGSDRKNAIIYQGDRYMLKFSTKQEVKNDYATSNVNNVISEYIGSHIYSCIGIPVHETLIGTYKGELVVACKNFLKPGEAFHEFAWYLRTQYDSSEIGRHPDYDQLYDVINTNEDLMEISRIAVDRFWDMFVVDALIGNFDRHSGNWGYIIGEDDEMRPAPVYDCGSCLYPGLSTQEMNRVLESEYGIFRRLYEFPKALLDINKEKTGYYDMLASGFDENCSNALLRIHPRIDLDKLVDVIMKTPAVSSERKRFYCDMISYRKKYIIDRAYAHVHECKFDEAARNRIGMKSFVKKEDVFNEMKLAKEENI